MFPYIRQNDNMDCGPCCLCTILKYYGQKWNLAEHKEKCDFNRNRTGHRHPGDPGRTEAREGPEIPQEKGRKERRARRTRPRLHRLDAVLDDCSGWLFKVVPNQAPPLSFYPVFRSRWCFSRHHLGHLTASLIPG